MKRVEVASRRGTRVTYMSCLSSKEPKRDILRITDRISMN